MRSNNTLVNLNTVFNRKCLLILGIIAIPCIGNGQNSQAFAKAIQLVHTHFPIQETAFEEDFTEAYTLPSGKLVVITTSANDSSIYGPVTEELFSLDCYLAVVDTTTMRIEQDYFESADSLEWHSDAIRLTSIQLLPNITFCDSSVVSFGLEATFIGSSKPNPYFSTMRMHFMEAGDTLIKVFEDHAFVVEYGEWDTSCAGFFVAKSKSIKFLDASPSPCQDMIITTQTVEEKNTPDPISRDCETIVTDRIVETERWIYDQRLRIYQRSVQH